MFRIEDNVIELTRGDNATITIEVLDANGEVYEVRPTDQLVFTVKKDTETKEITLQKIFSDNQIEIAPADTEQLPYGEYVYDVQLRIGKSYVDTIITPSPFLLLEEVNF